MLANKKLLILTIVFICFLTVSAVSAADDLELSNDTILTSDTVSNSHNINSDNYEDYFDSEGNLISKEVNEGDTVNLNGDFENANFIFNMRVNVVGVSSNMKDCSVKLNNGSSGSTVSNLKIHNYHDYEIGIFLNNTSNCLIQGCFVNNTGASSFAICLGNGASYNNLTNNDFNAYGLTYGHGTRSTSPVIVSGSHHNYIANNVIGSDDANAIYLSSYSGGPFIGGPSNFNLIYNNTVKYMVLPTSWSYGIQITGGNNTVKSNKVIGAFRGISTSGSGNIIINNSIINLTSTINATETGGEFAISGAYHSVIINNTIINAKIRSTGSGISALDYSTVENNIVDVVYEGNGINLQGSNILIKNNTISTVSGSGIFSNSYIHNITIDSNNITSASGAGILIKKASDLKIPYDFNVVNNQILTNNDCSIDLKDVDDSKFCYIRSNTILNKNSYILTPGNDFAQINLNSTGKGVISIPEFKNIPAKNISVQVQYLNGEDEISIPVTWNKMDDDSLSFALENTDFTTAMLTIDYNNSEIIKKVMLKRIYNAKIVIVNNVNEYKTGNFTFRLVDVDDASNIAGKTVKLVTVGNIRAGFSAFTDANGIATFKTIDLFEFENSESTVGAISLTQLELDVGNHTVDLETEGNVKAPKLSVNLTIVQAHFKTTVDPYKEHYGSDKPFRVTVTNSLGEPVPREVVKLSVDKVSEDYYLYTNTGGVAQINVENLLGGNYLLRASCNDTENIHYSITTQTVTIIQDPINITVRNVTYKNDVVIEVEVPDSLSGSLETMILNNTYYGFVKNGSGNIILSNLSGGVYNVQVYFSNSISKICNSTTFEVYRTAPALDVRYDDLRVSGVLTIHIVQPDDITGNITLSINDRNYSSKIDNATATYRIDGLKEGNLSVHIYYAGDDNYFAYDFTDELNVLPLMDPKLDWTIRNILYGEDLIIKASIDDKATRTIDLYIDGSYEATIDVESAYTLQTPSIGEHALEIVYSGDDNFKSVALTKIFRTFAFYPIEFEDTQIVFGTDKHFEAIFYDEYGDALANKYVIFNVNGTDYPTVTDSEGIAVLNKDFEIGHYEVMIINPKVGENTTSSLLIFSSIESEDYYAVNNTDFEFNATFLDEHAKKLINIPILFKINGADKVVWTDNNGVAAINLNMDIGVYDIISINTITNENKTNKLFIKSSTTGKYTREIGEKDINIPALPSSSGGSVNIKLPGDATGTITLTIKGKDYEFDVKDGMANVKVPELENGKYPYTIKYSGDNKYSSFMKTGTLTVSKTAQQVPTKKAAKTTLTLKTAKVKKTAKKLVLQATLKQGKTLIKNKKIVFKFNGKKYTAKTNKKGVAKITIKKSVLKKLKVGKKVKYQASFGKITVKKTAKVKK